MSGNDTETLSRREVNPNFARSGPMSDSLSIDKKGSELILRCECGEIIGATEEKDLVEKARLHFGEFHPDLGAEMPADLILAMAEQKEA